MRNKILIALSVLGILGGIFAAYIFGIQKKPQPPVFQPAANPYPKGIYANGIIESYQAHGENINIYPEVEGRTIKILTSEGQFVKKGTPLIMMDNSVQAAIAEQQRSQADAARSVLEELRAQPRKENMEISKAQVTYARASLKSAEDQYEKLRKSFEIDPKSVSRDALDTAANTAKVARANLEVVERQYELTKAGAWVYDIRNQERQYNALLKAYAASNSLLSKYTITAPIDGIILSLNTAVGSYISPQGTYETYTQGFTPVLVMGTSEDYLGVRVYIDEILVHRLPQGREMRAQMTIRGTNTTLPLEFVRVQPYVTPKIQLSNQRAERVDVRVLPIIFKFQRPKGLELYPGQLVDVYIGERG